MKRPLCIICLVFVVCMLGLKKQLKEPPFYLQEEQKNAACYMGQIQKKEYKENQIYLYLSNVVFLSSTSDLSTQIKNYQNKNSQIGCICYLDAYEDFCENSYRKIEPKIGAIILVKGNAVDFFPASNLGMFDQKEYYQRKELYFAIYGAKIYKQSIKYSKVKEDLYKIRKKIAYILVEELGERNGGVLSAIFLGDKELLLPEIRERYQHCGIAHVLAISGLHISILGWGFFHILRRCKVPSVVSMVLSFIFLIVYGVMVGGSVPTVRAIIMFIIYMGGKILGRSYDVLTAMAVAASVLVGTHAGEIDVGFLLSFAAIMGLIFLPEGLSNLLPKKIKKKVGFLEKAYIGGTSVFLTSMPILAYFYFGIAPLSILVNLIVIPLLTILLSSCILLIVTSTSIPFMSFPFRIICEVILSIYEKISIVSEKIPGYFLVTGKPEQWIVFLYYLLLIIWIFVGKRINKRIQIGCLMLMTALLFFRVQINLQVEVLDVGQGDGIYVETGTGYSLFIDGGSTTVKNVGTYRIAPYLKAKGVTKIDYLFFTHYDKDHICGWIELFKKMNEEGKKTNNLKVTTIVVSKETKDWEDGKELLSLARDLGISICTIKKGDVMNFRGVTLRCVYPGKELTESANENSLVLLLNKDDFSMLLTGDLEGVGEQVTKDELRKLSDEKKRESIEILKIGHHGSKNASSYEFLEEVGASIGVISYGRKNIYGHPAKETINRLKKENMRYYGTGEDGAVLIESNGRSYWIETFNHN